MYTTTDMQQNVWHRALLVVWSFLRRWVYGGQHALDESYKQRLLVDAIVAFASLRIFTIPFLKEPGTITASRGYDRLVAYAVAWGQPEPAVFWAAWFGYGAALVLVATALRIRHALLITYGRLPAVIDDPLGPPPHLGWRIWTCRALRIIGMSVLAAGHAIVSASVGAMFPNGPGAANYQVWSALSFFGLASVLASTVPDVGERLVWRYTQWRSRS